MTTLRNRWNPLRVARISAFSALAVLGSFIHLPGPVQTVSFDSAPGFFAALMFGPIEGALVLGIGHLATATVNGLPLGLVHVPVALGLAVASAIVGIVNRTRVRLKTFLALALGVAINVGLIVLAVPVLGWAATLLFAPFLTFAAIVNALAAGFAFIAVKGKLRL